MTLVAKDLAMDNKLKLMLEQIELEAQYTAKLTGRNKFIKRVMDVMGKVPREKFIPAGLKPFAYDNGPIAIGYGQTISQPYIVALMTDLLDLTPESVVLEIGTGSGYQAAILSRLAKIVYSVEKIPELAESASNRLKELGYDNIETRCSNGYKGWSEKAPFDSIIVTAAATHIPQALVDQLKPGGRMVIPVGEEFMSQELILVVKELNNTVHNEFVLDVVFVPLVMDESDAEKQLE